MVSFEPLTLTNFLTRVGLVYEDRVAVVDLRPQHHLLRTCRLAIASGVRKAAFRIT